MFCDSPPTNYCLDDQLRTFDSSGICQDGICSYQYHDVACDTGCEHGECTDDPCAGMTCVSPPADKCEDNVAVTYSTQGSCDKGTCEYEEARANCADTCFSGQCCTNNDHTACGSDNDVHWFDSCGQEGSIAENCADPNGVCVEGSCKCQDGWAEADCSTCVRYVAANATGAGTGLSWNDAFADVQSGIDAAYEAVQGAASIDACEVWVAQGTYYIYGSDPDNTDHELDTVQLMPGVRLYGGFSGSASGSASESARNQRNWRSNTTVLSGWDSDDKQNQVYHVVTGSDGAVIDGVTITGGNADGDEPHNRGGGMYIYSNSPTIKNCTFSQNEAVESAGGMFIWESSAMIDNCIFDENTAGFAGGGLRILEYSSPTISNCVFKNNSTANSGGGLNNGSNCTPTLVNCVFFGNSAAVDGGAITCGGELGSNPTIINCTIANNTASRGAGLRMIAANPSVTNSVFWGNTGGEFWFGSRASLDISYSNVQGGYAGTGNIDQDPQFVDPENGDFRVQSDSPCIDAADGSEAPELDIEGNPRVDYADDIDPKNSGSGPPWADMGAHEYQP